MIIAVILVMNHIVLVCFASSWWQMLLLMNILKQDIASVSSVAVISRCQRIIEISYVCLSHDVQSEIYH